MTSGAAPGGPEAAGGGSLTIPCRSCGAALPWSPEKKGLRCPFCGTEAAVDVEAREPVEHDLIETLERLAAERRQRAGPAEAAGRREAKCGGCGATTTFGEAETAGRCAFCGSPLVLVPASKDGIVPEHLVPFAISAAAAGTRFREWIRRLWFRPRAIRSRTSVEELRSVYLPFFTFDMSTESLWRALAGYYYYVTETYTETVNGQTVTQTRQVQHVRWVPASGERRDDFDDVLVCASKGVSARLSRKIEPWRLSALVPFKREFLSGFIAERCSIELPACFESARAEVLAECRSRCGRDVPGDTQTDLSVRTRIYDPTFKHVLLPLHVLAYRFRNRLFHVLVNGQTGEVQGDAPLSWVKIALLVLTVLVLGVIVAVVVSATNHR